MGNAEPLHNSAGDHLVIRLLLCGAAAPLDETALAVQNRPSLFQPAVRSVVRRHQTDAVAGRTLAEQDIAHIVGERVGKEVNVIPSDRTICGTNPILVGQAQAKTFFQQDFRGGNLKFMQCVLNSRSAGRDSPALPPCVECGAVNHTFFYRDAHWHMFRRMDTADCGDCSSRSVNLEVRHGRPFVHENAMECHPHFVYGVHLIFHVFVV